MVPKSCAFTLTLKISISIENGVIGRSREVNVELLVGRSLCLGRGLFGGLYNTHYTQEIMRGTQLSYCDCAFWQEGAF